MRTWLLRVLLVVVPVAVVAAGVVAVQRGLSSSRAVSSVCRVASGTTRGFQLDLDQTANATTIAVVGKAMGLPDHAVTVAVAAALQESGLRNLAHGDLDSLGLFQQRPSQGWGTPAQIMTPTYAASAFFTHLIKVPNWQTVAVTDAAQQVQRSAAPQAYAVWEPEARAVAQALTGEVPAALTCRFVPQTGPALTSALSQAVSDEVGQPGLGVVVGAARGWTVASWLVGHAYRFRLTSVSFGGQHWTPKTGRWRPDPGAGPGVTVS